MGMLAEFDNTPSAEAKPQPKKGMLAEFDTLPSSGVNYGPVEEKRAMYPSDAFLKGAGKGVLDTLHYGPAQLIYHAGGALGSDYMKGVAETLDQDAQLRRQQLDQETAGTGEASAAGQVMGGAAASFALPASRAAQGASLVGHLISAAKTGAIAGAVQPVETDGSYAAEKAKQVALGAGFGVAGSAAGAGAGKVLGGTVNAGANLFARITGNPEVDAALAKSVSNASPQFKQSVNDALKKGQKIDPAVLARQAEADSLPIPMSLTKGQATQDPTQISLEQFARGKNQALVQKFNDQNTHLVQNLEHVRDASAPEAVAPDHITAGETMIGSLQNVLDAQKQKTSALYKQLSDANGGALPMDGQAFAVEANKNLGQGMKAAFLPPQVQGILEQFRSGNQPMTFENFENLRTILAAEARKAERSGDGNTAAAVSAVRNTLENMPVPESLANIKPLADAARASAKEGFDMQRASPALADVANGKATADSFIRKHVVMANKNDLENLAILMKDDPVGLQTMRAGVVNYLKNQAEGQTGNFSQAGYNKAMQALGPKLDVLFDQDHASVLRTIGNVARYTQVQPRGSFVNNSNTAVANLAHSSGSMLAAGLDRATMSPIGSLIQQGIESAASKKANAKMMHDTLNPIAGAATLDETRLRNKLANIARSAPIRAGTSLAAVAGAQNVK